MSCVTGDRHNPPPHNTIMYKASGWKKAICWHRATISSAYVVVIARTQLIQPINRLYSILELKREDKHMLITAWLSCFPMRHGALCAARAFPEKMKFFIHFLFLFFSAEKSLDALIFMLFNLLIDFQLSGVHGAAHLAECKEVKLTCLGKLAFRNEKKKVSQRFIACGHIDWCNVMTTLSNLPGSPSESCCVCNAWPRG